MLMGFVWPQNWSQCPVEMLVCEKWDATKCAPWQSSWKQSWSVIIFWLSFSPFIYLLHSMKQIEHGCLSSSFLFLFSHNLNFFSFSFFLNFEFILFLSQPDLLSGYGCFGTICLSRPIHGVIQQQISLLLWVAMQVMVEGHLKLPRSSKKWSKPCMVLG